MSAPHATFGGSDTIVDSLAAELTQSAYTIAHAHFKGLRGTRLSWLELELALWHTLRETVKKWDLRLQPPAMLEFLAERWEECLAELTDAAYRIMLCFGMRGSFLDIELSLHQTFRTMIESRVWAGQRCGSSARNIAS